MKRLVVKRKLKWKCICGQEFSKCDVYYKHREVYDNGWGGIFVSEYLICPRCLYKSKQQKPRYEKFQEKCIHPKEFIETVWDYIPGECVKEPQYDQCRLCNQILY